jgi:uncharacterized protein (DUF169 family)
MTKSSNETDYSSVAGTLAASLSLKQEAVAICFSDSLPAGVQRFQGRVPAGCRFWEEAANKPFATLSADHSLCAIGIYTHHLETSRADQTDLEDALGVFRQLGYVRDEDLASIPVLRTRSQYVIYAPLSIAPLPPDVVILFVDASQTLILSEATQQVENQNAPALGRPACAVVPQVINTGRAALSLGCCGARAYLDVLTDDVALFAIPGAKLDAYARRIQVLAAANQVLSKFHQVRRRDIANGQTPTVQESLAAMANR